MLSQLVTCGNSCRSGDSPDPLVMSKRASVSISFPSPPVSVSVVIPVLNEEQRASACVARAKALGNVEVIVVDGGSTDRTRELACGADKVLHSERGRANQMNAGAAAASSEVLLFLHADCWLEPAGLDEIRSALEAHPDVVGGGFRQILECFHEQGHGWLLPKR